LRDPDQQFFARFMFVLGILIGVAVGPVALADPDKLGEPGAIPVAPHSTAEPLVAPDSTAEAAVVPNSTAEAVAAADSTADAAAVPNSPPEAVAAPLTGPQVYNAVCIACHSPPGVGGAPPLGDGEAWAARIAQGMDVLIDHALHGFSGSAGIMPRKGGRVDLSDEEIIGAVKYMVKQAAP
jgi:cytochrome c5